VFQRCPHAWLRDEAAAAAALVHDALAFERDRILPDAGGRLDQSPHFLECLDIVREQRLVVAMNDSAGA